MTNLAGHVGSTVTATITRPGNQTPYAAADVVGGAITFSGLGPGGYFGGPTRTGGNILITSAELEADIAAIPSGMTSFTLHLYSVTPPSAVADNGAFDLPSGDRASYLGSIAVGTPVDLGATLYVRTDNINAHVNLASADVFGYLVTAGGFTPAANSEVYKVTLHAVSL